MSTAHQHQSTFTRKQADRIFTALTSADQDLKQYFNDYLAKTYGDEASDRLHYMDIAEIASFIVVKFKIRQVDFFPAFFVQVETILANCDSYVNDVMVFGLFEGIQHLGALDMDYHFGFDQWLGQISKSKWDGVIDSWEGRSWRNFRRKG